MRQRRNAARRARRSLHVRNTDAPQLLQALVHGGAVTFGKHTLDSTLGRAYKQLPMYEIEFLVELKRIADALEALAPRPPVSLVSSVTTPQEQQEHYHPQRHVTDPVGPAIPYATLKDA